MPPKIKITAKPAENPMPTYQELAELVAELTEINIANLDSSYLVCNKCGSSDVDSVLTRSDAPRLRCLKCGAVGLMQSFKHKTHRFVSCFTYGAGVMPPHWQRAIDAREALIDNKAIVRQNRRAK